MAIIDGKYYPDGMAKDLKALRAENKKLREALQTVVDNIDYEQGATNGANHTAILMQTRAALMGAK